MAHALVVYESMFGNTGAIAREIAAGLAETVDAEVVRAGPDVVVGDEVALLVVGGPTHAFGLTRPSTRDSAGQQGAPADVARGPGLREWLASLPPMTCRVAAFDTRIHKRGLPGSAARGAERRLGKAGGRVISPAMSFWVTAMQGPLAPGEADRARSWGRLLATRLPDRRRYLTG
jgi:hypothetical protein